MPFCFHKCHYCDFYSLVEAPGREDARHGPFVDRLLEEIDHRAADLNLTPETIFVGGGTPTLLSSAHWRTLLTGLRLRGVTSRVVEWTVEANPETVTADLLATLVEGGVNRVSIGAQSFQPDLLKTLERWHDPANVARAVHLARQAGIAQVSLDLIFGTPGQTLDQLDADIDAALALNPDHLSYYGLTYEPQTALTQRRDLGRVQPIDPDLEHAMFSRLIERLTHAGFEAYEISNWARRSDAPGQADAHHCQHNLIYWRNGSWLGVGPAAASHIRGWRWRNLPNITRYLAERPEPPITDQEHVAPLAAEGETLMLGLRLSEGVPLEAIHSLRASSGFQAAVDRFTNLGLIEITATHLRLTPAGRFLADPVITELMPD